MLLMRVLNKIREVIKESSFENENNQEIVPVRIQSEDEKFHNRSRALLNSSIFSEIKTKTLGV